MARIGCFLLVVFTLLAADARAADYWPLDTARTYVFGEGAEEIRFVIDPQGGAAVDFRVVGQGCDVSWTGAVSPEGRIDVTVADFYCPGVIDPVLPLDFGDGAALFDPARIGGPTAYFGATSGSADYDVYARLGNPGPLDVGGVTYQPVRFEVGIQDPFLVAPIVRAEVDREEGPVRVNGLDRVEVIEGIGVVSDDGRSWSRLKALYD